MKANIKTAEEVLNSHYSSDFINDDLLYVLTSAMKEYAEQFIDLAADKVFIEVKHGYDDWEELNTAVLEERIKVNKQSILKVKQLIK